jgi:predicted Fe-S protein YdhL (DUF1289 family)
MSAASEKDPASPCIGVCTLNPGTQLCEGCFRNLTEIAEWMSYSPQQKHLVLRKIEERCERLLDGTLSD